MVLTKPLPAICAARFGVCVLMILFSLSAWPEEPTSPDAAHPGDADYIARFLKTYPTADPAPALDEYASPARYDALYLGDHLDDALKNVSNEQGGIAWGLSYRMMSLNEMFRVTGDVKYLVANLKCIQAVLAARDDKTGVKTWKGIVAPAWSSGKYAERGRAVFAVHTGIITWPMLEFVLLAKGAPGFASQQGDQLQAITSAVMQSLAWHDPQWCDGPAPGEGHYIGMDQENVLEGKPLPGNRQSAMGMALWMSWKVTGNTTHRDHALAIGLYIKNRLTPAPDGGFYWPYWLPAEPVAGEQPKESVSGEDVSHAGLTIELPIALAADGQVFAKADTLRLANTVLKGFGRLGTGILFGDVTGDPKSNPEYAASTARWLALAQFNPDVRAPLVTFFLRHKPTPSPLDLALLLRYGKADVQAPQTKDPPAPGRR